MSNTEQQIEQVIQSKNLNAPRLTPDHIDSKIKAVEYILPRDVCKRDNGVEVFDAPLPLQTLTFCILTLENGFTVTGESACASPENFDAEIGKKIAFENARNKIWQLEGYLLKENLHKQNSKVELQAGIDQLLNTRIPILDQIYDLCQAIEKCGASPELTNAVRLAGELRYPISKLVDQALKLGIGEGIVGVSYSDNGSHPTPDLPEFKNDDVKSFEPSCSTQACVDGSSSSNGYQLNAKRENAFLVAQLLSNNKISAELRKKAEAKMTSLLDELI
nr:Gp49 family protein [Acinetobacter bereziniae]